MSLRHLSTTHQTITAWRSGPDINDEEPVRTLTMLAALSGERLLLLCGKFLNFYDASLLLVLMSKLFEW